ncbi:CBS/transporter associated domain protein [Leadbettera azotonutricia ZAS-9]|uniref:CBS/transporter associated domain protein n=2 Tax=Leadbettera azotonutricia TaxID=150829 RepID=F5Y6V4_LEAAZ|nr:CBS/transporter associated domain protein [Leadbettera azotonutricia ZAS-9]
MEYPPDSGVLPYIFIILAVIFAGGFLSLLKTALACARTPRLHSLAEGGKKSYAGVLKLSEKSGPYQASLRIGIIFLEILSGIMGGIWLSKPLTVLLSNNTVPLAELLSVLVVTLLTVTAFFILGEVIPRQIAIAAPEAISAAFLPFIKVISIPGFPLLMANSGISGLFHKMLSAHASSHGMTEDEFRIALLEGEKSGIVESEERTMVEGVFYLGDRPVGTFMTHRSEVQWLDIDAGPEEARKAAESGGDQRYFPVADGDLDEVSGAVSVQDILQALLNGPWPGLKALMRTPYFVPETMSALKAFEAFKKAEANYLFVMDEYGGFAGILTVRNLIEEIVGQLSGAASDEEGILKQEDGTWLADGAANIDDMARALSLSTLADGHAEYHTLAGFILDLAGEIPRTGAFFDYNGYRFKIVDMDGNRIDKVMIAKLESDDGKERHN